jgi:integrase
MEQDQPLPFDKGCIVLRHAARSGWPKVWCPECRNYGPSRAQRRSITFTTIGGVEMTTSIDPRPAPEPTVPAALKAPRKPRRPAYDSLVCKRCGCDDRDWETCHHAWHYHVTFGTYTTKAGKKAACKFRGTIPDATTIEDARKKYSTIVANIQNGRPPLETLLKPTEGLTVAQLGEDWLALPRGRKPTTIDSYRHHLRAQINPVLGHLLVSAVTPEDCERWILAIRSTRYEGKDITTKTKKSMARSLHALFQFAIEKRKRTDNPAALLSKAIDDPNASPDDGVVDPNDHTKYFTQDEAQKLLVTCREKFPDWYLFVLTGLQTGMRLGEIRGLCYEQINRHGGYINVDQAYVKDRWTTPKNGKARTVSIPSSLGKLLLRRRLWRDRAIGPVEALYGRRMHLVFPSRVGTPFQESRIAEWWDKLLETAELGYRVRHAMRHTHTSLLLQNGAAPAKVAEESGRSLAETMATYAHFLKGGNRGEAEMLSSLLNPQTHVSGKRETTALNRARTATNLTVVSQK